MAMIDVSPNDSWQLALAPFAGWPEIAARRRHFGGLKVSRRASSPGARNAKRCASSIRSTRATLRDLGITDIESVVYGAPEGHKRNYDPDWWRKAR